MARPPVLPFSFGSSACPPRWLSRENFIVDRAALDMCAREITKTHQEFTDDLAAGEDEGLLE
jgi:hypothetical protein